RDLVLGMPREPPQFLARGRVPEADCLTGRGYRSPVGCERNGKDHVCMSDALVELSAGRHIPDADRVVLAGRGQGFPIGREGDELDCARVPFEPPAFVTRSQVPQTNGVVPTPRSQSAPVRGIGNCIDTALVTC